ncbi:ABC transporter substrate-binding protein [Mastigocoleus sp. MO_188.B34]|uniref:ABC transporter substrate-binding protein n=1 Tax=Mastigocoleus sp. MO_188.B34 TaxID=3036635 RepID=UPI00260552C2|nr:ABC transporter substrate-binding protein [Mastigocoleus sp. MO_188.B34]MDJ0695375.1 ABC transporter substrate-binding protein [Mastigocoleus sp. MO_188.B34]
MTNQNYHINPYTIGNPIRYSEKFFGRESLFGFIEDNLNQNIQFILLHGQRRIGKSSVLQQSNSRIAPDNFVFVLFDLQGYSKSSLSEILYELAEEIASQLELDSDIVIPPSCEELTNNLDIFSDDFLIKIFQELDDRNLVLLLDEFDVAGNTINKIENHGTGFFKYLKSLLNKQNKLFIIPVIGRKLDDLHNLHQLFKDAPFQEVSLLDITSTKRLIINPAKGVLEYEKNAIEAICELSSGHPYFTQTICFNLFVQAEFEREWTVTREHVSNIVDRTIESAAGGLAWFWDGLYIPEQVVFSAVAEAQQIALEQNNLYIEHPLKLLKKFGVIQTEELIQAVKRLTENKFLDKAGCRVRIELVRRWLVEERPVKETIWRLEKIEAEKINQLLEEAKKLHQEGNTQEIINCYEQILRINPNHFSTLDVLAERYLEIGNFDKALELYQRAYQVDPVHHKEGFLIALENYGKSLIKQQEYIKAEIQFNRVLEIEPNRESAKKQLAKIKDETVKHKSTSPDMVEKNAGKVSENSKAPNRQRTVLSAIAAGIIALVGGISVHRFLAPCPEGQQKFNGSCLSNISRGDRTFFPTTHNRFRNLGIEAFKKGNYSQAVNLFGQGVKNNRNDPEVLIYYNNAKARQEGNPFTLAVAVPVNHKKDESKEILRGVAQAQEEFNANRGSRLLEIAIADDSNKPDKAGQIAQQLVRDKSILGVIGHYSSESTEAALNVYKIASMPVISPSSTATYLSGDVFFRTVPSDAVSGETLAKYAKNSLFNKVVIFYNRHSPYSNSLREEFKRNFLNFQGQILSEINFTDPTLNIKQKLQDSASQQVQAVMLFPDVKQKHAHIALNIAKVNAENNLGLNLLGGDTLYSSDVLKDGGNAIEGLVIAVPWFREAPLAKDFSQTANKQWGGGVSWVTATSYDATQAFIKSLALNSTRNSILQELRGISLSEKQTSGDVLKFTNGERQSKAILVKVEQNQFKCLQKNCSQ